MWILDSFLSRTSTRAKSAIKSIQIPLDLRAKPDQLKRCKDAFVIIRSKLPKLQRLVLELAIDARLAYSILHDLGLQPGDQPEAHECLRSKSLNSKLYPALAFAHTEIVVDVVVYGEAPNFRDSKGSKEWRRLVMEAERQLAAMLEKRNARQLARARSDRDGKDEEDSLMLLADDAVLAETCSSALVEKT